MNPGGGRVELHVSLLQDHSGAVGLLTAAVMWGGFAIAVVAPSSLTRFETNTVYLACVLAVLTGGVAAQLYRPGQPIRTLFLASPFIVVVVSLPPVIALLLLGTYPGAPVSGRPFVVAFIEERLLDPVGLARFFANTFHREGTGYILSWLLYSIPIGWLLGAAILQVQFVTGVDL